MVLIKNLKFFHVFIFGKICQENVFDDILERKKAFLDSKIKTLKKSKNQDFFFIKNLKFFHVFIFGKKSQQNVFHDILERKKAFLDSAKCVWQ